MIVIPCLNNNDSIEISDRSGDIPELECPFCHTKIRPIFQAALFTKENVFGYGKRFVVSFPCCNGTYIIRCDSLNYLSSEGGRLLFNFKVEELQLTHASDDIPAAVKELSPSFVTIYNEARAAHNHGLTQIVGGGYRKALEFLIKDYAILLFPEKANDIKTKELKDSIGLLKDTPIIKNLANRVAWLGNDEVHFIKTFVDKDIDDLRDLLVDVIKLIGFDLDHRKALSEIRLPK